MAKRSDDSENFIIEGTLTVINHPTNGAGNIEVTNILYTDVIRSNTISGVPVDINEVQFLEKAMMLDEYNGSPPTPASGKHSFYIQEGLLKSISSASIVTTYQPTTTKGDLLSHDGTTQIRLPAGVDGTVLVADSSSLYGIKWDTISSGISSHGDLSGLLNDDHTQYALLAGRTGGQILTGGTTSGNNLVLRSTSNITKGSIIIDETTASTSNTVGALRVSGGIGISNTTDAISSTNGGTITTAGGVGIAKKLFVGNDVSLATVSGTTTIGSSTPISISSAGILTVANTTASTSTTTGSVIISGGVGISGALYASSGTFTSITAPHGGLTGLLSDDHSQYANILGRTGGQILIGGTAANNNLTLRSTFNATKGSIIIDETTASTSNTAGALRVSGGIGISNTTDATSSTNGGTITTAGGVGIAKKLFVGNDVSLATVSGTTTIGSSTQISISSTGILTVANTTASTSTTTGSVIISGGIGISNTTDAVSSTNGGTITTAGGVGIAKKLFVGTDVALSTVSGITTIGSSTPFTISSTGILNISNTTASTNTTSGSVTISGGIGISNTTDAVSSTNGGTITTAGGIAIAKKAFIGTDISIGGTSLFNNYFQTVNITEPSVPPASNIRFYTDAADSLLKSKNNTGTITTYQPTTTKGDLLTHNGTTQIRLPVGVNNTYLIADSTQVSGLRWGNLINVYYVYDQKAQGTDGGSATANNWLQRTLNTINEYPIGTTKVTLSGSDMIFQPGVYKIIGTVPFSINNANVAARLFNVTSNSVILTSLTHRTVNSDTLVVRVYLYGIVTFTVQSTVRLQYFSNTNRATFGLGRASGIQVEKFSHLEIQLIEYNV